MVQRPNELVPAISSGLQMIVFHQASFLRERRSMRRFRNQALRRQPMLLGLNRFYGEPKSSTGAKNISPSRRGRNWSTSGVACDVLETTSSGWKLISPDILRSARVPPHTMGE